MGGYHNDELRHRQLPGDVGHAVLTEGTRADGVPTAIKPARRRRVGVTVVVAVAVAFIAVGCSPAPGTLGGSDRPSPIGEPTTPSPEAPTVQESTDASPPDYAGLGTELDAIVAKVPGWAITDLPVRGGYDYAFNGPCSGFEEWTEGSISGGDGGIGSFGDGGARFASEAEASEAAARFVENLESCTATAWRTQPIAQTGAVLASSADGVAWIQQKGARVRVIQVPTTDGPPPVDVQVEVAEWLDAYIMAL